MHSKRQKIINEVIIYCRISTPSQSSEAQEFACKEYCNYNNLNIVKIIHEVGSAYKNIKLKKLEDLINNNKDKIILIYSIDRFSRNLNKCNELLELIEKNNLILKSAREEVDLTTPLGRHNFRNYVSQAQFESEMISERIKNTLNYKKNTEINNKINNKIKETDKLIIDFITNNFQQNINSKNMTLKLYKLLKTFNKPKEFYTNIEFLSDDVLLKQNKNIIITAGILCHVLNEYDLLIDNKPWKEFQIYNICNKI
jgi:DNA invertase Pin-like site-specific DNA recombinase